MKTAILLTGQMRNYNDGNFPEIIEQIDTQVDYFICTSNKTGEKLPSGQRTLGNQLKRSDILLKYGSEFVKYCHIEEENQEETLMDGRAIQWDKFKHALDVLEITSIDYDLVIRLRPDLRFKTSETTILIKEFINNKEANFAGTIFTEDGQIAINDQFFMSKKHYMFGPLHNARLVGMHMFQNPTWTPEMCLGQAVSDSTAKTLNIPQTWTLIR